MKGKKIFIHTEISEECEAQLNEAISMISASIGYRITKKNYLLKLIKEDYERLKSTTQPQ